jgi:hypothetical protein
VRPKPAAIQTNAPSRKGDIYETSFRFCVFNPLFIRLLRLLYIVKRLQSVNSVMRPFLFRVAATLTLASVLVAALSCGGGPDPKLVSITVLPSNLTLAGTPTIIYTALGHYTQPKQTKDITAQVLWQTDAPSILAFSDPAHPNYLQPTGSGCGTNLGVLAVVYQNPGNPSSGTAVVGTSAVNVQCGNGSGADFSLAATPLQATVAPGSAVHYTITVGAGSGSPTVGMQITGGVPAGANATLSPASIKAPGICTLTVTTSGGTPSGTYPILITGSDSSSSLTISVILIVN